jgi:hypothetical protein
MKMSFMCSTTFNCCWVQYIMNCFCPQLIWVCSFTNSSCDPLSLPPADLNTFYFPSQGPLYCPYVVNFSRSVEKCWCHLCQGFCKFDRCSSCLTIFLVRESTLIFQRSWLFKSNCWNEIKEMSIFESILKIKLLRSKIQHTLFNVVLWLSCILKTEIDPV